MLHVAAGFALSLKMTFEAIFFRAAQGKICYKKGEELTQNRMLNKLISILSKIQFNFLLS